MGNNKKGKTDGYSFVIENIGLILGTFGTCIFNYIFPSMVMGIITCITSYCALHKKMAC